MVRIPRVWSSLVASFAGKALGFVRVQLIVVVFGASSVTDALFLALTLLALFDAVFVSGSAVLLAQAAYARAEVTGRARSGLQAFVLSASLWTTLALIFTCTVLLALPLIVNVLAPGFDAETRSSFRAIVWAGAAIPALSVLLVFASTVNRIHGREALFSVNQIVVNGVGVGVLAIALATALWEPLTTAQLIMVATVIATATMLCIQYAAANASSVFGLASQVARFFSSHGIRSRLRASWRQVVDASPLVAALLVQQLLALAVLGFASTTGTGGVAAIGIADRLTAVVTMLLVGTCLTVLEPRWARAAAQNDSGSIVSDARFVFLLVTASAATIACVGDSIIRLLFGYGAVDEAGLRRVSEAVVPFSIALPFSAFVLLATRALAVVAAVRVLPAINAGALGALAVLAYGAIELDLGLTGVAFAYCAAVILQAAAHYWALARSMPTFRSSAVRAARLVFIVALTAVATWGTSFAATGLPDVLRVIGATVTAFSTLILGAVLTREPLLDSARRLLRL